MNKPSIAELLNASGYTIYTEPLVMRAMYALYGNIGANLDERNWSAILQSSSPLEIAETSLLGMYQDSGYLLRNTQHLIQSGYSAAQAEYTYRQMADRLGFTYQPDWSTGTPYENLGQLSTDELIMVVPEPPPPPPLPTIAVASSATGFTVTLNVAGKVKMSVSGDLDSFAAGETLLTEQANIQQGFLSLTSSSNNNTSAATSQYVVLGTADHDTIDTSAAGNRVDYILGGAGYDTLSAGEGDDVVSGGSGDDKIYGNEGNDLIYGGDGNDIIEAGEGDDTVYGGGGDDNIDGGTTGDDLLDGGAGADTLRGGVGNDTITGGDGRDALDGGDGNDVFRYTDNLQLKDDKSVGGGDGTDTISFSVAIDTLNVNGNFNAAFGNVTSVERIELFGSNHVNLGEMSAKAGLTTIAIGTAATTLRYDNAGLGTLTIDATSLADNTTLALTQFDPQGTGQWFNVTHLKGDINAQKLKGGITVTAATGADFDISVVGGKGNDTLNGGTGNDFLEGSSGADILRGGAGADVVSAGADTDVDTVRADEGDGQMLIAGEIALLDSDQIQQFNATHDKFAVSGAGTSVILNGAAATQTAGAAFQEFSTSTFDMNGTAGGAYITEASAINLRSFNDVEAAIGALHNESVGEEAYFALRESLGAGKAGVYHFRSLNANNQVDVGEIELLGLILTSGDLAGMAAANFVFA